MSRVSILTPFRCLHSLSLDAALWDLVVVFLRWLWTGESLNSPITYLKTLKLLFIWNDINENARRLFISWTESIASTVLQQNSSALRRRRMMMIRESEMMMGEQREEEKEKKSWRMFTTRLAIIWDDYENYSLFKTLCALAESWSEVTRDIVSTQTSTISNQRRDGSRWAGALWHNFVNMLQR